MRMKRIWALLFLLLLLPLPGQAEKAASFPAAFQVKYTVKDKLNTQTYLSWEYVMWTRKSTAWWMSTWPRWALK